MGEGRGTNCGSPPLFLRFSVFSEIFLRTLLSQLLRQPEQYSPKNPKM